MKTISTALASHFGSAILTPAECVAITKVDGSVLAMTSHDRDITFEGVTYRSGATFELSAIKSSADFSVDNAELTVAIDGTYLTKAELLGDNLREAAFEVFVVNWQDLSMGKMVAKSGNVGEITIVDDLYAKIQLRGLFQKLSRGILDMYSPTCRATFGDAKCGFAPLPTKIRMPGMKAKTSDWFLVPIANVTTPVMTNSSFEANGSVANGTSGVTGWTYGAGSYWQVSNALGGDDGSYYLEGGSEGATPASGAIMTMHQQFTTSSIGMPSIQVDAGTYSFSANISIRNTTTDGNVGAANILFINAAGNVISKATTGVKKFSSTEWTRVNLTEFVPPGTRAIRIELVAYKNVGASAAIAFDNLSIAYWTNEASTFNGVMYKVVRIPAYGASDSIGLLNNTFTADGVVSNGTGGLTDWTATAGSYFQTVTLSGSLVSSHGATFLKGGDDGSATQKTYELFQTRDVVTAAASIDAGRAYFTLRGEAALTSVGSALEIRIDFLTTAGTVISMHWYMPTLAVDSWSDLDYRVLMPANTRKIKTTIRATSPVGDSAAGVAVSIIDGYELNIEYESPEDARAGYASEAAVTLDPTIDALSNDGDLIVQARPTIFEYSSVATVVTDRAIEIPAPASLSAADLYGGKIRWLSGANAGKTSIIRAYDSGSNLITLYQTLSADTALGDRFIITRGCDKRIATCGALRNNMNFRGEPYLPGTSKVITYFTPQT